VTKLLDGTWAARGKLVAELAEFMAQNALQFAAATTGETAAYRALHTALAKYDTPLLLPPDR
jgi:hypothetical protein